MSSFPAVPISNVFNTLDYNEIIDGSLSLSEADNRYFKLIGGTISGFTTFLNSLDVIGNLSINSVPIDLSLISGVVAGTPQNSKALTLDILGNINGNLNCTQLNTSSLLSCTRSTNGRSFQSVNGSSSCVLYHFNNQDAWFGTSTANNLILQTNNTGRLIIDSVGNITGISSLTTASLIATNLTGTLQTAAQPNITSIGTLTALNISGITSLTPNNYGSYPNNIDGCIYRTISGRIFGFRELSGSTSWAWGWAGGGSYNDYLTLYNTGTYRMTLNGNFNASGYYLSGTALDFSNLSLMSGITPGSTTASKALVVDSNKRITDIDRINITSSNNTTTTGTTTSSNFALNILSTVNSNGQYNSQGIAFLNAASDAIPHGVISSVRTASAAGDIVLSTRSASNNLSENLRILSTGALSINYGASPDAMLSCIGSSSYSSANYQRLLRLETSNASPIQFGVHLNLNTSATITNATYVGNLTANDLHFGTNTSAFVALKHTGSMMVIGSTTAISSTHKLEVLGSTLITDSTNTYTMPSTPSLGILNGGHTNNSRIEYQTIGKYVNSSDYSAWTTSIYYQNVTGDTANYITLCPSAKTSTSTGWGFCMNRNGQCSFQDSNSNSGSGGLVVGGNIIATLDVYGGVTRSIGANGALRANATPAVYNGGGGSTRIGLFVQNAIWTSDQVYASSDVRLKRNIEPIELNEAKKLLSVQSVSYRLKKDNFDNFTKSIGVIAQDVIENGLDKLVSYVPNNDRVNFPLGYHYGVSYDRMTVYLLEIVKDLYKRIEALESTPNRSTFNH